LSFTKTLVYSSGDRAAINRSGAILRLSLSGDALFEIDRFRRKEGREIKPLTVREILDEEIATT
jgi:hypothetical protein